MDNNPKLSFTERLAKAFRMVFSASGGRTALNIDDNFHRAVSLRDLTLFPNSAIDYRHEVGDPVSSSLIAAAIEFTARVLPEAPLVVIETDDSVEKTISNHPVANLIKRPNPFTNRHDLLASFALDWIASGNVYLIKIRNSRGAVIQLEPVSSGMIKPVGNSTEFISHYKYRVDNQTFKLETSDVIHFRNGRNPYNPRLGLSPIAALYREIYSDNEASNFQAALLRNFGVGGLVISPADSQSSIDADSAEFLKAEIHSRTTGDNRGKPLVAGGAIRIERLSFDPKSLDLKSLRRLPEERVASVLGIPAVVLGFGAGLDRSTFANYSEAREAAYESYIVPLQALICETLDNQLLSEFDTTGRLRTQFDLSRVRILQQDETALVNRLAVAYRAGIIRRSEARSQLGLSVTPDDDAYYQAAEPEPESEPLKALTEPLLEPIEYKETFDSAEPDIDAGEAWWRQNAPAEAADLIDATAVQ